MAGDSERAFVFGVDLDGVCADYTRGFRDFCARRLGVGVDTLPLERSWDFREWGFAPDEYARYHRIAVMEHDMFRTMPLIDGSADAEWMSERITRSVPPSRPRTS